ncbi:MAG: aldo/keto reductase [Alphaproteobacteria bacterium]|nr:aldo/keto reductase [Alphaproteobacteria bacterium]
MKQRQLGNSGLSVSAIGLGCMVMPGFYGPGDEAGSIATIHHAVDIGITHLDTSDAYGAGKNEELVGRAIKGRRDDFVIATKFGNIRDAEGKPAVDGRPEYVAEACDASLRRLGIDVIDLYYQHRIDPSVPIEDTVGAMARLVEAGKVRYLGLSEAAPETLRRAHAAHPMAALQTEYSLWTRHAEEELLPLCRGLGIGYVAYSPLGRGMFGGGITGPGSLEEGDRRASHPRFQAENLERNVMLVEPVKDMAADKGCSPAVIALAWVLAKGEYIVPIPGTRTINHLEENAAAQDLSLSPEEVATLDEAIPPGAATGERYPPGAMKHLHK